MQMAAVATVLFAVSLVGAQARTLLDSSSASAVSVSGGEGPFGNCGFTSTTGNAAAYASGPPCGATIIPAPPPSTTCPSTTVTVDWQLPASGAAYKTLTLCPGSTIGFRWNTGSPAKVYGLYQIPTASCPTSFADPANRLIITPASSPNAAGVVSATLNAPGTYYFADPTNCGKGQMQAVIISQVPGSSAGANSTAVTVTNG